MTTSALLPVYDRDIVLVKGKGSKLWDSEGREWLDFAAGIAVNGFGYGDRKIVAAIKKQAESLIHTSNLYHNEPASRLAARLVAHAFPAKVFFTNSGTEAWEGAMKFARRIGKDAGRTEYVAFEHSFHGRSMGALSTTWTARYREPFEPLIPGVRFVPRNDLAAVEAAVGERTAAVMIEPVQGEGGIRPAAPEFLKSLERICRAKGCLLVFDEIQCGLGRTGKMFAFQHSGVVPDILTIAKPLAGGLPMGAILLKDELAHHLHVGDHGSTFGGNAVCAAAANAVLDHIEEPGFLDEVGAKGLSLQRGLKKLARKHKNAIAEIRGLGLMVGVEFRGEAGPVLKGLKDRGILAVKAGDKVLRLLPPLVVKRGEIKQLLAALDEVLGTGAGAATA
ncbi:MAG: acetylornithine/succinylornithine family transaminase [Vicinamibacteria bacterium]